MRESRQDFKVPDHGLNVALVIGGIGAAAIALLVVAGWALSASGPSFTKALPTAAAPGPTAAVMIAARPSTSFIVPTPTFVTPSVLPTGPRDPLLPPEIAAPEFPTAARPAPPTPQNPPVTPPPTKATPPPAAVSGVALRCDAGRHGAKATVSLVSTGPVVVTVTAAGESRTQTVSGRASVSVVVDAPNPRTVTCSAVVAGKQLGPIPAR